jgi:hypothetical protein
MPETTIAKQHPPYLPIHKYVCTYYIHLYIFVYMYIHVHVVMYLYVYGINIMMSVPCSDTYVPFCPIPSPVPGQVGRIPDA